jgi:hypothetical protein
MNSLNVGCGLDPWGDVRVDIAFEFATWHLRPTIIADARYLPFKDYSFEVIKASHVLEHIQNPFKALDELLRISKMTIILSFPTKYDVLPWFISNIFPIPNFSAFQLPCLTRKKRLHLWIINPLIVIDYLRKKNWKASCERETVSLFAMLEAGRKAKYFRWLTKRTRIPFEYVIAATKQS